MTNGNYLSVTFSLVSGEIGKLPRADDERAAVGAGVAEKRMDFPCDAASQWQTIIRYADVAGLELVALSAYVHDDAGRLTSLTHAQNATTLANYDWSYDRANRVSQFVSLLDGATNYIYGRGGKGTVCTNIGNLSHLPHPRRSVTVFLSAQPSLTHRIS